MKPRYVLAFIILILLIDIHLSTGLAFTATETGQNGKVPQRNANLPSANSTYAAPTEKGPTTVGTSARHDTSQPLARLASQRTGASLPQLEITQCCEEEEEEQAQKLDTATGSSTATVSGTSVSAFDQPMPSVITSFDGMNRSEAGGLIPPDTNGAVGPNHYLQLVNIEISIYNKQGTRLLGPASLNSIWSGFGGPCENGFGDPIALYDHFADRWLVSQLVGQTPSSECVAVSQTGDPLGSWFRYQFQFTGHVDYPKLGVWPDGYYMSTQGSPGADGAVVFERQAMLVGGQARFQYFEFSNNSLLPADVDGPAPQPGASAPFADFASGKYEVREFHTDWDNPSASSFGLVATLSPDPPLSWTCVGLSCVPQPGTTQKLANNALRLMNRLTYRRLSDGTEHLIVTHTTDADPGHNSVRWTEFVKVSGDWAIAQQGVYAPNADHRFTSSGAMDKDGNIAIGYNVSSATTFPSIRYAGRLKTDPSGTMRTEGSILEGSASQTFSSRWGDYSAMVVDPQDDCTFWYTNEYVQPDGNWGTRIGSFSFGPCTPTAATLASFSASQKASQVKLSWRTGSELEVVGFNLWRRARNGKWRMVNRKMIAAKDPGSVQGAAYIRIDKTVEVGKTYRYKLELVKTHGLSEWSEIRRVRVE